MERLGKQSTGTTQQAQAEPILKVIRRKSVECSAGQPSEVRHCPVTACPLWPYRMGSNPFARPRGLSHPTRAGLQKNSSLLAENSDGNGPSLRGWRVVP